MSTEKLHSTGMIFAYGRKYLPVKERSALSASSTESYSIANPKFVGSFGDPWHHQYFLTVEFEEYGSVVRSIQIA